MYATSCGGLPPVLIFHIEDLSLLATGNAEGKRSPDEL